MRVKWVCLFVAMAGLAMAQQETGSNSTTKPALRQKIRVSPGVVKPLVLKKVVPEADDLKSAKDADVRVVFEIDETGRVESATAKEGDPTLYERSEKAIKEWRFKPFTLNDKPIMVESFVYFHFHKGKAFAAFHQ